LKIVQQLDRSNSVPAHFEFSKQKSVPNVFEVPLQQIAELNFTDKMFKICEEPSDFVL
jgi:hypothetical protein